MIALNRQLASGFYAKLILPFVLLSAVACGLPSERDLKREEYERFVTAVEGSRAYDAYWLGRDFTANEVEFEGPAVGDLGGGEDGESLTFGYAAPVDGVCCYGINLTLYSTAAWEEVKRTRGNHPIPGTQRDMTIIGFPASFMTVIDPPGVVQALALHVFADDTVIEAVAGAATPLTPTDPQPNPLANETTFLAVMEKLRPYPE